MKRRRDQHCLHPEKVEYKQVEKAMESGRLACPRFRERAFSMNMFVQL